MSIERLREIVHSEQQGAWSDRNRLAFAALFGSPEGRYPKAASKVATVRAPEMSQDSGVAFAAYIHPLESYIEPLIVGPHETVHPVSWDPPHLAS